MDDKTYYAQVLGELQSELKREKKSLTGSKSLLKELESKKIKDVDAVQQHIKEKQQAKASLEKAIETVESRLNAPTRRK